MPSPFGPVITIPVLWRKRRSPGPHNRLWTLDLSRALVHALAMTDQERMVADALKGSWVHRFLPEWLWPYAQLARWERPIGWWLLMWPCWWSAAMVTAAEIPVPQPPSVRDLGLFMIGAILMRGAGCTYNDIVDREIDDKVARTRSRPLPSGRVSLRGAAIFLMLQLLAALAVLLQFNNFTIMLGFVSMATVVVYPFMKRVTWWPQFFLGLAFSWGALMGWAAHASVLTAPPVILYAGCILWVIGYDTIYAHQDIEDDTLVGVKSTARLFGDRTKPALIALYAMALVLFAVAIWLAGLRWPAWAGLLAVAAHMGWQIRSLDLGDPARCLALFKSNSILGWLMFGGLTLAGLL